MSNAGPDPTFDTPMLNTGPDPKFNICGLLFRMHHRRVSGVFCVLLAFSAVPALAQEKRIGVVAAFPLDAGVFWQASERVALRADFGGSTTRTTYTPSPVRLTGSAVSATFKATSSSVASAGVSALFTIRNKDNLRLYVVPRAAVVFTGGSIEQDVFTGPALSKADAVIKNDSDITVGTEFRAMFGGQYRLHDRVAAFAETGVGYQQTSTPPLSTSVSIGGTTLSQSNQERQITSIGTRAVVGLVFFF